MDGQRNRTGSSRGALAGLNAPPHLYVGGYSEHTPELLPLGARFRLGFQGKSHRRHCCPLLGWGGDQEVAS